MGYTHYWRQIRPATDTQWKNICEDFNKLRMAAILRNSPFPIQREYDDPSLPEVSDTAIIFNGIGEMGHETLLIEKDYSGFAFCKTKGKPYDNAVMLLLVLAYHYAPDVWDVTSDGEAIVWQPIAHWMNEVTGINYRVPDGVVTPTISTY